MNEYKLLDSGDLEKLEQVGPYKIVRPALACLWPKSLAKSEWDKKDAYFKRTSSQQGSWFFSGKKLPQSWQMSSQNIKLNCQLTSFGHLGFFPEHHNLTGLCDEIKKAKKAKKDFSLLNLFAYTGFVSCLAASKGASVTHVDSSKTSLNWARDNAKLNNLNPLSIRFILDDVKAFVKREVKRKTYDAIVLDPPSYGRGAKSQVWQIEKDLLPLLFELKKIMSKDFSFLLLSSHTPGLSGEALKNILVAATGFERSLVKAGEMTVAHEKSSKLLPAGTFCLWQKKEV